MVIATSIAEFISESDFLRVPLDGLEHFHLKIEGRNPFGSVKAKAALSMLRAARPAGTGGPQHFIESTSGSLGIALAGICAAEGDALTCVIDANTLETNAAIMRTLGAEVVTITTPDANGGFLGSRIAYIEERLSQDPDLHWLNQYDNPANVQAHAEGTAIGILNEFDHVDHLFIGTGTGGTLMGCLKTFRDKSPDTNIVAVDTAGSVTFSGDPAPRYIPGLGTSRRPPQVDISAPDHIILVPEREAVRECRWLARKTGMLAGGSTGTVLAAVRASSRCLDPEATVVAISPDFGERYIDSVYDDAWVSSRGLDVQSELVHKRRA